MRPNKWNGLNSVALGGHFVRMHSEILDKGIRSEGKLKIAILGHDLVKLYFINDDIFRRVIKQVLLMNISLPGLLQVRDLVERCTCPTQFPMIRVSEGKYRIGDTKVLIFVRILRSHVMVRVGGGWDTLSHYLDKHDPCRCRTCK